jgi:hypothetical protein
MASEMAIPLICYKGTSGVVTACAKCAMHTQKSEFRPHFVLLETIFFKEHTSSN